MARQAIQVAEQVVVDAPRSAQRNDIGERHAGDGARLVPWAR